MSPASSNPTATKVVLDQLSGVSKRSDTLQSNTWAQEAPSWAHFGPPLGHQKHFLRFKKQLEAIKPKMLKMVFLHQFFKVFATSTASLAELRGLLGTSWGDLGAS